MLDHFAGDAKVAAALRRALPDVPAERRWALARITLDDAARRSLRVRARLSSACVEIVRQEILDVLAPFDDLRDDVRIRRALRRRFGGAAPADRWALACALFDSMDVETNARLRDTDKSVRVNAALRVLHGDVEDGPSPATIADWFAAEEIVLDRFADLRPRLLGRAGRIAPSGMAEDAYQFAIEKTIAAIPSGGFRVDDRPTDAWVNHVVGHAALDLLARAGRETPDADVGAELEAVDPLLPAADGPTLLHRLRDDAEPLVALVAAKDALLDAWIEAGRVAPRQRNGVRTGLRGRVIFALADGVLPWTRGTRRPVWELLTNRALLERLGLASLGVTCGAETLKKNACDRYGDTIRRLLDEGFDADAA